MLGDRRVRECKRCAQRVYNVSGMPASEAVRWIQAREGRECPRLIQRTDGTLVVRDCASERSATLRRVSRIRMQRSLWVAMMVFVGVMGIGGWVHWQSKRLDEATALGLNQVRRESARAVAPSDRFVEPEVSDADTVYTSIR